MLGTLLRPLVRPGWRRMALLGVGVSGIAAAVWFCRGGVVPPATAQSTAPRPVDPIAAAPGGDYASRVVAYIHQSQAITRQDLGEYLIARHGIDRLALLVNKRMLDHYCQAQKMVVTAAEVDHRLEEDLKGLAVDRQTFIKSILVRYKKNLYEYKEDILRPRLQMTRLCEKRVEVSEEDLRKAFESMFGEKVECRVILWPKEQKNQAMEEYGALRDSEEKFAHKARNQHESSIASSGGKIKPIARWSENPDLEKIAFELKPGQVSTLFETPQGTMLLKCDRRLPADTTVNFEAVKPRVEQEIRERKLQMEMATVFQALREQARPQYLLGKSDRYEPGRTPAPSSAVAMVHGKAITREELGEFLIARLGGDKLEYLVNHRILVQACQERNITVSEKEVDDAFKSDLDSIKVDAKVFERDLLSKWNKNVYEWREDVVKPRLMLSKLSEGRVKVNEDEVKKGFEAYYGERVRCRMILWPQDQAKHALMEYAKLRDSDDEFSRKAKSQSSPTLAAEGGKLPDLGRHTLGDESLEREVFRLQKGEMTPLIGTPQGQVVIKCDERLPPDTTRSLEKERPVLIKEISLKKMQLEMQVVFKELRDKARPRLLLTGTGQPEDLLAESQRLIRDAVVPPVPKQ